MRVSVASSGGGVGAGCGGIARSRNARYSSTGSTTHPSGTAALWARTPAALAIIDTTSTIGATRARHM